MRLLVRIRKETFENFKESVIEKAPNDYYNQEGVKNTQQLIFPSVHDKHTNELSHMQAMVYDIQFKNVKFPFNVGVEIDINNEMTTSVNKLTFTATVKFGYHVDESQKVFAYRTCKGNTWGMFEHPITGNHYIFFWGKRSRLCDLSYYLTYEDYVGGEVKLYETNAPDDMKWYQDEHQYMVSKGIHFTATRIARLYGEKSFYKMDVRNKDHAHFNLIESYEYFKDAGYHIDELIKKAVIGTLPKNYLLSEVRKGLDLSDITKLEGKSAWAWELLPDSHKEIVLNRFRIIQTNTNN